MQQTTRLTIRTIPSLIRNRSNNDSQPITLPIPLPGPLVRQYAHYPNTQIIDYSNCVNSDDEKQSN